MKLMTEKEKIKRCDALKELRQRIGGCFGDADLIFAGHTADEDRAKELRKIAFDAGISLDEVLEFVLGFLILRRGVEFNEHIKKQLDHAREFFGKKLSN